MMPDRVFNAEPSLLVFKGFFYLQAWIIFLTYSPQHVISGDYVAVATIGKEISDLAGHRMTSLSSGELRE